MIGLGYSPWRTTRVSTTTQSAEVTIPTPRTPSTSDDPSAHRPRPVRTVPERPPQDLGRDGPPSSGSTRYSPGWAGKPRNAAAGRWNSSLVVAAWKSYRDPHSPTLRTRTAVQDPTRSAAAFERSPIGWRDVERSRANLAGLLLPAVLTSMVLISPTPRCCSLVRSVHRMTRRAPPRSCRRGTEAHPISGQGKVRPSGGYLVPRRPAGAGLRRLRQLARPGERCGRIPPRCGRRPAGRALRRRPLRHPSGPRLWCSRSSRWRRRRDRGGGSRRGVACGGASSPVLPGRVERLMLRCEVGSRLEGEFEQRPNVTNRPTLPLREAKDGAAGHTRVAVSDRGGRRHRWRRRTNRS